VHGSRYKKVSERKEINMLPSSGKFYSGGGIPLRYAPHTSALKILDLGCGAGSTAASIKKRQEVTVIGVTVSQFECDVTKTVLALHAAGFELRRITEDATATRFVTT
jgi:SAM-dependent methyltransferase